MTLHKEFLYRAYRLPTKFSHSVDPDNKVKILPLFSTPWSSLQWRVRVVQKEIQEALRRVD